MRRLCVAFVLCVLAVPALAQISIRTGNPGAMWPGPIATRYGSTSSIDGLPGGNKIAVFADPVQGAAAQFALLNEKYAGLTIAAAIARWSGSNFAVDYAQSVAVAAALQSDSVITPDLLASPAGIDLAKAMAKWEAGRAFPLTDEQWREAQAMVFALQDVAEAAPEPSEFVCYQLKVNP